MSILLISKSKDFRQLKQEILQIEQDLNIQVWPAVTDRHAVQMAVAWDHSEGVLESFPNLQCVMSYGAGTEHLINDVSDRKVKLCRMVLESLNSQIADYVLMISLIIQRKYHEYLKSADKRKWKQLDVAAKSDLPIGVMGAGQTGIAIAELLSKNGFRVNSWSGSVKTISGVNHYSGSEKFHHFLNESCILVCALPLTPETEGILNLKTFKGLQKPAYLINVARGNHLVEEDLIYSLDAGILAGAILDTFQTEPLPDSHTFWNREEIIITPHIAALTHPKEAASLIVENYKRIISGMDPLYMVDKQKGY
jgi:glyoxylate/hydroxypyruvate reductase A